MNHDKQPLTDWSYKSCDGLEWAAASVPGCIHTDLLRDGLIPDPFYGTNEQQLQWIDKLDWEYECWFDVSEELYQQARLELVLDGLDTYADVSLNGTSILTADNMFRSWRIDVKPVLKPTNNRLHIRFRSPIQEGLAKLEQLGYGLPASNDQSEHGGLQEKKVSVFTRKAPYHYGWDWGPRLVTSGIWKEVYLVGWSGIRMNDLYIRQDSVSELAAEVTALVEIESEGEWSGTLELAADGQQWACDVKLAAGVQTVMLEAKLTEPKLWWSRGLGEQHRYSFKAALYSDGECRAEQSIRTGLRSIRLVQNEDTGGTSFYFELNGKPVFAKGANHIPNDSFAAEVTWERYRHEIATAVQSNMNMLRVWGGGIYENDAFYELCDEYGIMVWQDFMFACSMYPGDETFLSSVKAEAEDNIRRLRNHPCIVLWCGNNEIDMAWQHFKPEGGWGWKQRYSPELQEKLWKDYKNIFHHILPDALQRLAPAAEYWPSSPIQALSGDRNQHATDNSSSGDIHYWGVWHSNEPFEQYKHNIGRFMSEYGFQSFPEYRSVRAYASEDDLALESDVMLSHQRNNRGNQLIKSYMDMYLQQPKDFPAFLYMSQMLQAEAMKMAIEAHRRHKPYTMGTLYWQMNDCWPVASWASMDYYGRWKASQYYIRNSFQDVLLSVDDREDGRIDIHLVSDLTEAMRGQLRIRLSDFSGSVWKDLTFNVVAGPDSAQIVYTSTSADLLDGHPCTELVLVAELLGEDGRSIDRKFHYFATAKQLQLLPAELIIHQEQSSGQALFYTVETNTLARGVWLDADTEGVFSDNFFDLLPGIPVSVQFYAANKGAGDAFIPGHPGTIRVHSMSEYAADKSEEQERIAVTKGGLNQDEAF
ncbi:glycoside hydrolase family 2 protein [Paenibacillus sp. GCM10023252]|uniref:beta-mannosidase n=1 Tax=Paenibacillus sp. GCM10023252 TaxID=3252649 RepID=UPI0036149B0D